ncbi:MAG: hypothetical protein ACFCU8_10560 [Thermosynechococcaceae cyanobacterium]
MTQFLTFLVPQGAEYQAVCRGLRALPRTNVVPLPVGPEPVTTFLKEWCDTQPQTPVVVMGLCGSLSPGLGLGISVLYRDCFDGRNAETIPLTFDEPLTSSLAKSLGLSVTEVTGVSCDRIIHLASEKRSLAKTYRADVVDMEGFAALEILQKHHIPTAMLRVVSDDVHHDLPDLSAAISPAGKLQVVPMVLGMMRQPFGAIRLIRGSLKGLKVLEQLAQSLAKAAAETGP